MNWNDTPLILFLEELFPGDTSSSVVLRWVWLEAMSMILPCPYLY